MPEIITRSALYMAGIRWSVLLIETHDGTRQEHLLAFGFHTEQDAEWIKNTFIRMWDSGRTGLPFSQCL